MEFRIGGQRVAITVPTWAALRARVTERLAQRQGFALATINLDHLVKLRSSARFRAAYAAQDFVVADGNPIVWLSHLAGRPVELIPGSDAILPLARIAAKQGIGVALVGSTPAALSRARSYLEREVRDLSVVTMISPPMGFDPEAPEARAVYDEITDSGAGLCFVALGAPKQEIFGALGRKLAPKVGFAGIGAGLDFFAGTQKRAPEWARKMALEWLWRMVNSPRRLGLRYLHCLAILPGQSMRALLLRFFTLRP
ncbi:WecB/TagA/CpsF family glycosyltransferase [Salipiger mangrovisoli]|uniref:WecB/TagA/CpsF family glycosyltransferase n=1 Tax=Salipiger mangrovisoli TaxID=2865933 RepID=A0ABR9WXS4_9RHOB|nr:WecB/TagA/CpsF family glycosyltransferase [Salipiger mangrovisoli]MBE9636041.1 WecB/TagA/CpsF family glycosyltransferase [Salipiger mangrovisoli]